MTAPAPERPRYSTGFRVWLGGILIVAIGIACAIWVWKPLGIALIVFGGIPAVWFKFPSDWRRTWPDDFPVTARLLGEARASRFDTTVYDDTQRAWSRLSPRRRLLESLLTACLAVGIVVYTAVEPDAYFSGLHLRAWLALAAVPLLLALSIGRGRSALRDLRRSDGGHARNA